MPDDKGIIQAIGRILQRYELGKSKKKKPPGGLESNLGKPEILKRIATKDPMMGSRLIVKAMEGRTDEGAMMELRTKYDF